MTSLATGRRSTGSRGCWTPTKKPAPCQSQQLRSEQLGWASATLTYASRMAGRYWRIWILTWQAESLCS